MTDSVPQTYLDHTDEMKSGIAHRIAGSAPSPAPSAASSATAPSAASTDPTASASVINNMSIDFSHMSVDNRSTVNVFLPGYPYAVSPNDLHLAKSISQ